MGALSLFSPALAVTDTKPESTVLVPARVQKDAAALVDFFVMHGVDRVTAADAIRKFTERQFGKKIPAPTPATVQQRAEMSPLIKLWIELYAGLFGEPPLVSDKEAGHAKALVARYGGKVVEERLRQLAASDDPFVKRQGFTFATLTQQWPRLVAAGRSARKAAHPDAPSDCRHSPRCQTAIEHRQRYLADVKSSSSSGATSTSRTTSTPKGPSSDAP